MARKKREEPKSIEGGWINTFADLMNLLLCFFVLLFSMSTVDAEKYEQIVASFSEKINIFDGRGRRRRFYIQRYEPESFDGAVFQ